MNRITYLKNYITGNDVPVYKPQVMFNTAIHGSRVEAEVMLYDDIGFLGVTAGEFNDRLKAIGKVDGINLHIHSQGGDVGDALAMFDSLIKHPAPVKAFVDGWALSAASVIAMAGETIEMAKSATMMIHAPWTIAAGSASDLREVADILDGQERVVVDIYASRRDLSTKDVAAAVSAETWYNADKAVSAGLADNVGTIAAAEGVASAKLQKGQYRNTPKHLLANEADGEITMPWRLQAVQRQRELTKRRSQGSIPAQTNER